MLAILGIGENVIQISSHSYLHVLENISIAIDLGKFSNIFLFLEIIKLNLFPVILISAVRINPKYCNIVQSKWQHFAKKGLVSEKKQYLHMRERIGPKVFKRIIRNYKWSYQQTNIPSVNIGRICQTKYHWLN